MSCHYSCASCSASTYMYLCLSCPSTRSLVSGSCPCAGGYYEAQQSQCYLPDDAPANVRLLLPLADGLYYTNIALLWLYAILLFCRVNSPKIRIVINFAQCVGILQYYPYLHEQLTQEFLHSLSALNFSYFSTVFACNDSQACLIAQYGLYPLLLLPCLVGCFLLGYLITNFCYRNQLGHRIDIRTYWHLHWRQIIFIFMDWSAVVYGYGLTKAVMASYWAGFMAGVYAVGMALGARMCFRVLNSSQQNQVLYRVSNGWAYGYDENYHLYYIDYVYEQDRRISRKQPQDLEQSGLNQLIQMFIPHSNLFIFQILFKIVLGMCIPLIYQYKPALFIITLVLLLLLAQCWLGAFLYYDRTTLLLYYIYAAVLLLCACGYWLSVYWLVILVVAVGVTASFVVAGFVLLVMRVKMGDKLASRVFEIGEEQLEDQSALGAVVVGVREQQEQQEQQGLGEKEEDGVQQRQNGQRANGRRQEGPEDEEEESERVTQTEQTEQVEQIPKREPFTGNLTRKNITRGSSQALGQTAPLNHPTLTSSQQPRQQKKKAKPIFNQMNKADGQKVIRHSNYQNKIMGVRDKVMSRNRSSMQVMQAHEKTEESILRPNQSIVLDDVRRPDSIRRQSRERGSLENLLVEPHQNNIVSPASEQRRPQ